MVRVTVYVEGGSRGRLATDCRRGFSEFFSKAGLEGHMPRIVACGSRDDTFKRFCVAMGDMRPAEIPFLLVDSECFVRVKYLPWQHLLTRDNWSRPEDSQEDQAHLMVQCMEAWFLADVESLKSYFGHGFRSAAIPQRNDIENIPKDDILNQLESASRRSKKRVYNKGSHSFEILAQIDPERVIECSWFAERLIDTLKAYLITS